MRSTMTRTVATALLLTTTAFAPALAMAQTSLGVFAPQTATMDLNTAWFTTQVEEKFGVGLNFETTGYDSSAASEKRQISLASGDYPEVFMLINWVDQFSQAELIRYSQQGLIVPLNDLIEQHAPNILAAFEKEPEFRKLATAPDGNIYGLPQWNDCFHCSYSAKFWINTDWLNKLGLEMPTTTAELKEVLLAFKNNDPNGNGRADEIPLSANVVDTLIPYFMNSFVYDPRANSYPLMLALEGGHVQFQAVQDGWRDGLAYLADLYKEGLIDPGAFTQNREALQSLGNSSEGVILGSVTAQHPGLFVTVGQDDGRDRNYDPVPPLTGPDGIAYTSFNLASMPGAAFVITNKASEEQQIAAIKIVDYMFTMEGHAGAEYGKEGEQWLRPVEGDLALDPNFPPLYNQLPTDPNAPPTNMAWGAMGQYFSDKEWRGGQVQPTEIYEPSGFERRLFEATLLYEGKYPEEKLFPYWNIWTDAATADELAQLQVNLRNYVTQSNAEFVTGQRDINDDAAWATYLSDIESLGLARYLEIYQTGYDAN
ncbi:MAG: extracellular solute-binding protein [Devosia sp.]|uniref:extracellular solute-binding protein n=1 Tax=Devosia sp. TaxID=1871048 RepID=UPI0019E5D375|nr:extracellular solute-binding protein [Devosia sp.]MBF0680872.1 extracellular solute-binding protein [Devosia sp.]